MGFNSMNNETVPFSCSFSVIVCAYINFDGTANIADLMITIKMADYGISLSGHKKI